MRFYNLNPEKRESINLQPYIVAIVIGAFLALMVIGTGIGLKFLIKLFTTYWMWVLGTIIFVVLAKKYLSRKKVVYAPYGNV